MGNACSPCACSYNVAPGSAAVNIVNISAVQFILLVLIYLNYNKKFAGNKVGTMCYLM